jgi:hypothetical protein
MQTVPNSTLDLAGAERAAAVLLRQRFWIYLVLFLAAAAIIVAERRGPASSRTVVAQAPVASTSPAPATPDDRPLLLPDR